MPMTDALLQLSTAQAPTTGTTVSTNTIDLSTARDLGPGEDIYAMFTVDTTVTSAGAATVTFEIISSAAAALTSPTVLARTGLIGKAELTAARRPIYLEIPASVLAAQPIGQRYLGVQYTVGTADLTAGAFSCTLTDSKVDVGKLYASGFTVA